MSRRLTLFAHLMALVQGMELPAQAAGLHEGRLRPCPSTPNCVLVEVPLKGETSAVMARIKEALAQEPRTAMVEEGRDYLRAVATSLIFRFKDDVEFLFHEKTGSLQIRSASRVGRWDLGVNRRRVARILRLIQ